MTLHAFIDESARGPYLLCVVLVAPKDARTIRRSMQDLVPQGAQRLHMTKERDPRKRAILTAVTESSVSATVYVSRRKPFMEARSDIIRAVIPDLLVSGVTRLTIERIVGTDEQDRREIRDVLNKMGKLDALHYEHRPARSEPILWVADAIAWAWGKRGEWRPRIQPVLSGVVDVDKL